MAPADAAWAIREAFKVIEGAEDMLDETLQHARQLVDIVEDEPREVDRAQYGTRHAVGAE